MMCILLQQLTPRQTSHNQDAPYAYNSDFLLKDCPAPQAVMYRGTVSSATEMQLVLGLNEVAMKYQVPC